MFFLFVQLGVVAANPGDHALPEDGFHPQIPVIDLREHDFTRDGLARLDGEWAMFWNALIDPHRLQSEVTRDESVAAATAPEPEQFTMPGTWNAFQRNGDRLGGRGSASFAVRVLLPPDLRRGALRIPPASTSYRLWIDGREAAASGVPGTTPDTTTPGRVIRNPVFETATGNMLLLIHVANFDHRVGGMWRPIWIGAADEIAAYDIIDISYDLLLLGICLAFAAYNFLIYLASSRRSIAPLLFAAFFLAVSIRIPTLGAVLATRAVPGFPWHALIFIEYMTGHLIIAFFCGALQRAYPQILGRSFLVTVVVLMGAFSVYLVAVGVTRYSLIINAFLVAAVGLLAYPALRLAWAGLRGQKQARFGLLAVLVVLGIVVSEWAHFSELVLSRDATPVGFLLGVLSAPPGARAVTHLGLTSVTVLLILAAASLLMYKVSDGLFGAAAREAVAGAEGPVAAPAPDPVMAAASEPAGEPGAEPGGAGPGVNTAHLRRHTFRTRYNLTGREAEIASHAADGLSNKEIAAVLYISEATVRTHIYRIFKKTESQNRTELSKTYFSTIHA